MHGEQNEAEAQMAKIRASLWHGHTGAEAENDGAVRRVVPDAKRGDAAQLAIATTHRMDYLMSWNHAHLVNPQVQDRMQRLCAKLGWRCPWLVNPETIPKARLGHRLSRRD